MNKGSCIEREREIEREKKTKNSLWNDQRQLKLYFPVSMVYIHNGK